jgi:hypothetical protein
VLATPPLPETLGPIPPPADIEPATPADVPALPDAAVPSGLEQAKPVTNESTANNEILVDFVSARRIGGESIEALVVTIMTTMSPGRTRNVQVYLEASRPL